VKAEILLEGGRTRNELLVRQFLLDPSHAFLQMLTRRFARSHWSPNMEIERCGENAFIATLETLPSALNILIGDAQVSGANAPSLFVEQARRVKLHQAM
jgi:hypothetical protein